jgi:hypothetical protein
VTVWTMFWKIIFMTVVTVSVRTCLDESSVSESGLL